MKIAFPLEDTESWRLAASFHGSDYLGVVDAATEEVEYFSTKKLMEESGQSDLSMLFKQMDVETMFCAEMPAMALQFFRGNSLKVYQAVSSLLKINLQLFKEEKLPEYHPDSAIRKGCNSGSCATTSSSCSSCSSAGGAEGY